MRTGMGLLRGPGIGEPERLIIALAAVMLTTCWTCNCLGVEVDGEAFPRPPANAVTFWGHSCCYVDVDGYGIVTDPVFEARVLLRWRRVPAPPPSSYAETRLILISHAHPDHLSLSTLRTFPADVTVLCPEPSERYISSAGFRVRGMSPGGLFTFPGGKVVAVAAKHAGTRYGVRSQDDGGALGFVIQTPYSAVYYSGDTNLFPGIDEVGRDHAPDIAILNISGHLHGEDAVEAAERLGTATVIPVHFGAYGYLFLREGEKPRDCEEMMEALGDRMVVLGLGQSFPLAGSAR